MRLQDILQHSRTPIIEETTAEDEDIDFQKPLAFKDFWAQQK